MAAIRLSERELEALHGLPFASVSLYVLAIRPRMDYATGIAGQRPRLSYQALSEWCRVESRQGVAEERLSRHQLARLLGHLERAGLVRRRAHRSAGDDLVFRCPLADRDLHVRKNPAQDSAQDSEQNPAQLSHRGKPQNPAQDSEQPCEQNPAQHPGVSVSIDTSSSSSTIDERDDDDDDHRNLIFPGSLSEAQAKAARDRVRKLNGSAQTVLDELAGYLYHAQARGDPIRSPLRYLDRIIESARQPGWQPSHADQILAARQGQGSAPVAAPRPSETGSAGKARNPETAAKAREALRSLTETLKGKKP